MAPADVEWVFGVVRAGRDYQGMENAKSGGAGYEFTATIIVRGHTAEIVGGAGRLTPALAKEIEIALHSHGITTAIWERFNGDPKKLVRATRGRTSREEEAEHFISAPQEYEDRMPEPDPVPEPVADLHSIRKHHPGLQSIGQSLGISAYGNVQYSMNGFSQERNSACSHRLTGARAPQMELALRQKVGSR
ncbi:MAG TPA: hypothetical protein VIG90_16630 [Pedomonas sp.]|uniref:hypothetical protein n=1 Tax=Pedomonas sp. TaxID=2976421 RepID=UPI002F402E87